MIQIRNEQPADYRRVEEITRSAFWNLYFPGASEHYLVYTMRRHQDYIPALSFVIEKDSEIIGSIHFTHAKIITPSGIEVPVVHFGPVCITPALHRQGYGRALITHAISAAKAAGHRAIVLGGFSYHYTPYGFAPTKKYGITMTDGKFYTGIMALPLFDGALDGITGTLVLSDGLQPDESGFDTYENTFPPLEKKTLACQKEFEKAASELDTQNYL